MLKLTNKNPQDGSKRFLLNINLQKAIHGSSIVFIGTVIGMILALIGTIIVARFFSVGEYGLYGLTIFIVSFILQISALGINQGCSRYISFFRGKKEEEKVKGIISSSIIIVTISSIIVAIILFLFSEQIAIRIFDIVELSDLIKIFSISLPFWSLIRVIVAIFRGFESVREQVYFVNILINLFNIPFFAIVIFLDLPFYYIIFSFVLSIIITGIISIIHFFKKLPNYIAGFSKAKLQTKTLLSYSWPLVFSGFGWFLVSGADKIMIGIILSEVEVGIYNIASQIGTQLMLFLTITTFIYQPIASRLFAQGKMDELKRIFQILTKWLFTLTFPFIIIILLFPDAVISIFFGDKYLLATTALQLITIAYFTHIFLGPNGETIKILGKTKVIMIYTLAGGIINVILNSFLIPVYGIEGAAIATMFSLIMINALHSGYLYKISKIHPIRKKFVLPIVITLVILFLFYFIVVIFELYNLSILYKLIISILMGVVYFVIILLSKSFDEEDLQLLYLIEQKTGIRIKILKKILNKFI